MKLFANSLPDMFREELVDWDHSKVEGSVDKALADYGIDFD